MDVKTENYSPDDEDPEKYFEIYDAVKDFLPNDKNDISSSKNYKINRVSSDISVENIPNSKCTRNITNFYTSAAVYVEPEADDGVVSGIPFFSCLANAITSDRWDEKINRFDFSSTDLDFVLHDTINQVPDDP